MSKLSFVKYEGIGNDFILIDNRDGTFLKDPQWIRSLCHRKFGIGADGLILIENGTDFRMRIFNSDGSEAESCGNGLRCCVLFLKELGVSQETLQIEIHDRSVAAKWIGDDVAVEMGSPTKLSLNQYTEVGIVHFAHLGVPHVVQFVPDVGAVDLARLGPVLRHHPLFSPHGANVNIAQTEDENSIRVRTYERGVEAETLACGTGAAAVAAIARKLYRFGARVSIHFPGGALIMQENWMIGPARRVFSGNLGIQ